MRVALMHVHLDITYCTRRTWIGGKFWVQTVCFLSLLDADDFRSADPLVAAIDGEGLPGDVVVSDQEQDSACDILSGSGALEWKIRP
jgi:hypothetical protein